MVTLKVKKIHLIITKIHGNVATSNCLSSVRDVGCRVNPTSLNLSSYSTVILSQDPTKLSVVCLARVNVEE